MSILYRLHNSVQNSPILKISKNSSGGSYESVSTSPPSGGLNGHAGRAGTPPRQPFRARQLFSFSELVGTDLTLLMEDAILVRLFSYFEYHELFVLRRVCSRWKPLTEHRSLYVDLDMQSFIANSRVLPMSIVKSFISSLSMTSYEIDAVKSICREMPRLVVSSPGSGGNNDFDEVDVTVSNTSIITSTTTTMTLSEGNENKGHLRGSSYDDNSFGLATSNSSNGSMSSLSSSNDYTIVYQTSPVLSSSPSSGSNTPNSLRKQMLNKEARREKHRKEREKRMEESVKTWNEDIIPNWEKRKDSKKVRELIFQGVPSLVRSKVWPLLIGNDLNITPELFSIFGARAERAKKKAEGNALGREGSVSLIHLDLPRTFPMLSIFQTEGPLHQSLANVLEAYVCYRPDVGYVQGMSYLAALFLLILDEFTSFVCLTNLLNNTCYMAFYTMNLSHMEVYMKAMESLMQTHLPKVHRHLTELAIQPDIFMIDWVLTIFSKALPLDLASHVWDNIFLDGEIVIFQTALGILKLYSKELESADFDVCMTLLTHLPSDIDDDDLFQSISSFSINQKQFYKLIGKDHNTYQ